MAIRPAVSVLMPCLNPWGYLDEAIASALAQPELQQLIVADGGSDAATLERLDSWANRDARVLWWSKPDQGPADALNQALEHAEAEFIGWLNADDCYAPGALQRAVAAFSQQPAWQMVYGHGQQIDSQGRFLGLYPSQPPAVCLAGFQEHCFISQPSVVVRRSLLEQVGGFDPHWRCAFDLDLWLRIFQQATDAIGWIDQVQASTRLHPATITANQQLRVNLECAQLLQRTAGTVAPHWLETAARALVAAHPKANAQQDRQCLEGLTLPAPLEQACLANCEQFRAEQRRSRGQERMNSRLPLAIQTLLSGRSDLLALGFHRPEQERLLCNWLIAHGTGEYPQLFSGEARSLELYRWLLRPGPRSRLCRLSQALWDQRPEHQERWHRRKDARAYQQWLQQHWDSLALPLPSYSAIFDLPPPQKFRRLWPTRKPQPAGLPGVNLVGYASYALGIGEDLRTTYAALQAADVPVAVVDFAPGSSFEHRRELSLEAVIQPDAPFAITLVCLTPEELLRLLESEQGHASLPGRYVIGYWPWELPAWPRAWLPALKHVDEVWVSTTHIANALRSHTRLPLRVMPLCVEPPGKCLEPLTPEQRWAARQQHNLDPGATLFCFSFDLNSNLERKNPWGCIRAFQQAFPPALAGGERSDVGLVIKTYAPSEAHRDWEELKRQCHLDPRIRLIETTLSRDALLALYGCCDGFLSLHRAEGFGRGLAEALQLGLDVVATGWSGNTDFCDGPLAHPVSFTLVPVPPGAYPHWPDQHWAEPDLPTAASLIRAVVDRRQREGLPPRAWAAGYRDRFSAATCGQRYRARLDELGLLNAPGAPRCAEPG